jgi:hypothetical protein
MNKVITSRKAWITALGTIGASLATHFGVDPELIATIAAPLATYLVGISVEDMFAAGLRSPIFKSRKFWAAILGTGLGTLCAFLGFSLAEIVTITGASILYITATSIEDAAKGSKS